MSKPIILCRFCNAEGEDTDEDVLPKWWARELRQAPTDKWHAGQDVFAGSGPARSVRLGPSQTAAAWKLNRVCKTCNRTWMSTIEDRAKPRLLAMTQGRSVILTLRDRAHIARWAQLKWFCFDALSAQPLIAPEVAYAFPEATEPLPYVTVSLAPLGEVPPEKSQPHTVFRWAERVRSDKGRHDLVRVTFVLNSLAVCVIGPAPLAPVFATRRLVGPWFVECWPEHSAKDIRWDVGNPIPRRVFDAFAAGPKP